MPQQRARASSEMAQQKSHFSLSFACWRVLTAMGGDVSHSLPNGQQHHHHQKQQQHPTSGAESVRCEPNRFCALAEFSRIIIIFHSAALLHRSALLVVNVSGIICVRSDRTCFRFPLEIDLAGWLADENFLHKHLHMRGGTNRRASHIRIRFLLPLFRNCVYTFSQRIPSDCTR